MDVETIKKQVESLFMDKMINYISADDRGGLHVSNLVYSCSRKGYWEWYKENIEHETRKLSEPEILTFALGKKVHEIPLTEKHEYNLSFSILKGTADEILENEDGSITIIDKKTCHEFPPTVQEHHKTQVSYYAVMLNQKEEYKGKTFWGCVLYIKLGGESGYSKSIKAYPFPIIIPHVTDELITKIATINEAIQTGVPPPSTYSWLCNYCPFFSPCRMLDAGDEGWKKFFKFEEKKTESQS